MLECAFVFLMKTLLLMLRLSPADSFPKPLSKEEEREYLERWEQGDIAAYFEPQGMHFDAAQMRFSYR